jgi:membrane fusion protein (multidrug efflux system)
LSSGDIWTEANFKETDLAEMRPGQKAKVEIDSYPGRVFAARVASLSPGTGSAFSMLPPENASGNWVKVVQRLPVRVAFDPLPADVVLRSGLSAVVTVESGHRRSLLGAARAAQLGAARAAQ